MSFGIAFILFVEILDQSIVQINTGLIGQANQHKQDISHFIGQIPFVIRGFKALFAVGTGN